MGIPERLVEVRERHGYTRKRLAEELGKPYATITKYENGEREAGSEYLKLIAEKFHVTTDFLLGIEKETSPAPAEAEAEEVTREELISVLRTLHVLDSSTDSLSDADLSFLAHVVALIDDWFSHRS